jgi:hypothetical protein
MTECSVSRELLVLHQQCKNVTAEALFSGFKRMGKEHGERIEGDKGMKTTKERNKCG